MDVPILLGKADMLLAADGACACGEQEVAGSNPVDHCRDDPPPALSLPSPKRWEVGRASQRPDFSRFDTPPAGRLEVGLENIDAHIE